MKHYLCLRISHCLFLTRLFIQLMVVFNAIPQVSCQNLGLTIIDPAQATLCHPAQTGLIITNRTANDLINLNLKLNLPFGVDYIPGSNTGATESNISQLNSPEFTISSLRKNDSIKINVHILASCSLFHQMDSTYTFINKWLVQSNNGLDSVSSKQPYPIETPFLKIDDVNNLNVLTGSTLQRTITITNTRLGSLKDFIYEDRHDSLSIGSSSGQLLTQTEKLLRLGFHSSDFLKIGNRDSFFDRDESIMIIEDIQDKDCKLKRVRSSFLAYWGCNMDTCQVYEATAEINFYQNNERALLKFPAERNFPTCICSAEGTPQCLIIENTGARAAENIVITLKATDILNMNPFGFVRGSVIATGAAAIIDTAYLYQVNVSTCQTNQLFAYCVITLSELAPGAEVKLRFNYSTCLECTPPTDSLYWFYSYSYNSKCVPNITYSSAKDTRVTMENPGNQLYVKNVIKDATNGILEEGKIYTVQNLIKFQKKITNQYLHIQYRIPCPLRLVDTTFLLGGKAPIEKSIEEFDSTILVNLEYAPPFNDSIVAEYRLLVDCNFLCKINISKASNTLFYSTCPRTELLLASLAGEICIDIKLSCPNREYECGPCPRSMTTFELHCSHIPSRRDSVYSYLTGFAKAYRQNYGGSDPENDRLLNSGILDTGITDRKKLITGDTLINEFRTAVLIDDNRYYYDSILLMISTTPELTFDTVYSEIQIKDVSTDSIYQCIYPLAPKLKTPNAVINCDYTVITRSGFGNGYTVPLTPELLNLYGAHLPADFKFEAGDSINAKVICRISSYVNNRIVPVVLTYRAFFIDRAHILPDPFSCMAYKDTILFSTQGLSYNQDHDTLFICKSSFELSHAIIRGTTSLENFFNREIRNIYSLDSIRIDIPGNTFVIVDSFKINYLYQKGTSTYLVKSQTYPARIRNNKWEIDPLLLQDNKYDESYTIEINSYAHLSDCARFNDSKNTVFSVYYVNANNNNVFYDINDPNKIITNIIYSTANSLILFNGNDHIRDSSNIIFNSSGHINWATLISGLNIPGGFEFEIKSSSNRLSKIKIHTFPVTEVTQTDSTHFFLRNFDLNQNYQIFFSADQAFCGTDTIQIISRWLCVSDSNTIRDECNLDTITRYVRSINPELEMSLNQEVKESILCDTLPEIVLEIYNADKGVACDVYLDIYIPPGTDTVPMSLLYSYPKGSAYQLLPKPIVLGANRYRWVFADFIPSIRQNCLKGVEEAPFNSINLKLKLITGCDALVNSYPQFFTSGKNSCGDLTNSIEKTGKLIQIKGLSTPGAFTLKLQNPDIHDCAEETTLKISITKNTASLVNDSLIINLPGGLHFKPNSVFNIKNMPFGNPVIRNESGNEILSFDLKDNLSLQDSIIFTIQVIGLKNIRCSEQLISAFTYTRTKTRCSATQADCDVLIQSGTGTLPIDQKTTSFTLDSFHLSKNADSLNYDLNFRFMLHDKSLMQDSVICVGLYEDINKNNKLDSNDPLIDTFCILTNPFKPDSSYLYFQKLDHSLIKSCAYLLTTLNKYCVCHLDTIPFNLNRIKSFSFDTTICEGASASIGITTDPSKKYHWTKGNVPCDTCSKIDIQYNMDIDSNAIYHYSLSETDLQGCDAKYDYQVTVLPNPNGKDSLIETCPGILVTINAGTRIKYQWNGDSISDPLKYQQQFVNDKDRVIFLSFKDKNNCPSQDTFFIHPLIDTTMIKFSGDTLKRVNPGDTVVYCIIGGKLFRWEPSNLFNCSDCPCVIIKPEQDTSYLVTVNDSFNCPHLFRFRVILLPPVCDESNIFLPNAFSPNQDNHNDTLKVRGNSINKMHLGIYSRWGEKVFESFDPRDGWDGTFKGKLLGPDVFGYFLEVECIGGKKYFKKGNISLLK